MRIPLLARVVLYGFFLGLLALILTRTLHHVLPGRVALPVSRNSEGYVILLILCAWVDVVRPRLLAHRYQWPITVASGAAIVVAGIALGHAPWPSQVVTLNEALVGTGVLVVYLQLPRPVSRRAVVLPILAVLVPALGRAGTLTTGLAEAFVAMVLVPLAVDVVDRGLLRDQPASRTRNLAASVALLAVIGAVHLVTPKVPVGPVDQVLFYVQRGTEAFVAVAVMLAYWATRRPVPVAEPDVVRVQVAAD